MFYRDDLQEVSLGKRKTDYECTLMVYIPVEKDYATEGYGQLVLGSSQGENYILFTLSDGSELCWSIEKSKKFSKVGRHSIKFESPAECKIRTLKFQDPQTTDEVWGLVCQALSSGAYGRIGTVAPSPTSERSALSQACAATAVESMSSTFINTGNIDIVLSMIKDRPAAVSELFRTSDQVQALRETFRELRFPHIKWPEIIKLGELVRKVLSGIDSPCQFLLIGHDENYKLISSILSFTDEGLTGDLLDIPACANLEEDDIANTVLAGQPTSKERVLIARRMTYLRDYILDPTMDIPTRRSLGILIGDHISNIVQTLFHQRNSMTTGRWVAKLRKGCVGSVKLLREIAFFLASRDLQVGGIGVRNEFSKFFKDWRLGTYLASFLQRYRLSREEPVDLQQNILQEMNGLHSNASSATEPSKMLLSTDKVTQEALHSLTIETVTYLADGLPQILWQEFSCKLDSQKLADLLEELMHLLNQQPNQSVPNLRLCILPIFKAVLSPQTSQAPEPYGHLLRRLLLEIRLRLNSKEEHVWHEVINYCSKGLVWLFQSKGKFIITWLDEELWEAFENVVLQTVCFIFETSRNNQVLLVNWQILQSCIRILTFMSLQSRPPQIEPTATPCTHSVGSESAQVFLQLTTRLEAGILQGIQQGFKNVENFSLKKVNSGLLSGSISQTIHLLIEGEHGALISKTLSNLTFPSTVLSLLMAPLQQYHQLVQEEQLNSTQACEVLLRLQERRDLISRIQSIPADKTSIDLYCQPADYDQIPLRIGDPFSLEPDILDSFSIQEGVMNPSNTLYDTLQNGRHSQNNMGSLETEPVQKPTSASMIEEELTSAAQLKQAAPALPESPYKPAAQSSSFTDGSADQPRQHPHPLSMFHDVDMLDFDSTEACRLESLVSRKSPSSSTISKLGSRRASQIGTIMLHCPSATSGNQPDSN